MGKRKERFAELTIQEFSKNGHGIGSSQNEEGHTFSVEVPFTIPGDRVRAKLIKKRGGLYTSLLEEILSPSPSRIQPKCIHFGVCGGCRWQQQTYQQQLMNKEQMVRALFQGPFDAIAPCDPPWEYRNKMEFSFSSNAAKDRFLGLIMNNSGGKVVNLQECHLVNEWFVATIKTVNQWWEESGLEAYHLHKNTGSLRTLTLREGQRSGDRMVMLTVSGNPDYALSKQQLEALVTTLRQNIEPKDPSAKLTVFLRIQQIAKGVATNFYEVLLYGPETIRETLHVSFREGEESIPLEFHISPSAFFQPNTRQAEKLYSLALQKINVTKDTVVYDLYCGTGTLGICAAKMAKQVVGIELSPEAILDAKSNAARNHVDNIAFLKGDVGAVLTQIKKENSFPNPDIVMVDPPRAGLGSIAIQQIIDLSPPTILYVSCNPVTQAADVNKFIESGYRIDKVQPVDQFPQTVHVENIVLLKK